MAKQYFHGDITDASTDWSVGDSSTNNLPCSGESVQKYLKQRLASLQSGLATKPSHGTFENGKLRFYEEEGDTQPLFEINFSSTVTIITVTNNLGNSFTVLTSETEKIMTISATSKQGDISEDISEYQDVNEDYTYTVSIDNGNGYTLRYSGDLAAGGNVSFDIHPYLAVGTNRIKVAVTGMDTDTTRTMIYTATLTALSLTVNHAWGTPWLEGDDYTVTGIRFAGNIVKKLYISVDGDENIVAQETYSSSTSYTTTSISLAIDKNDFPTTTGIHTIHVWLTNDAGDVVLPGYTYNIMCVATEDIGEVGLVCLNNITSAVVNFTSSVIFQYATYNTSVVTFNISLDDENTSTTLVLQEDQEIGSIEEGVQYSYTLQVDYDSEATTGLTIDISAEATDNTVARTIPVDNTHAYIATAGAWFQIKPALRSNSEANPTTLLNVIDGIEYPATWSNFSFAIDGWYRDSNGIPCIAIPAGASVAATDTTTPLYLIPNLEDSNWTGYTLEFMIKGSYPSNYTSPILSVADNGLGLMVYPTYVSLNNSANEGIVVELRENAATHIAITWQRNYGEKTDGLHHLCTVYVNGVNNGSFSYSSNATWGHGFLQMGQTNTDTYVYMMRAYSKALEKTEVKNNFLNAMVDGLEFTRTEVVAKNNIVDGTEISYNLVKAAGFNTMVVEMTSGVLPDFDHQSGGMSNVRFEYAKHADWNISLADAPIDGQGTTSKKYFRWNLRWKCAKADSVAGTPATIWTYADGSTSTRTGFFDGQNNHPKVQKIVAKTNYASSMQGHKMGACGLYNDLAYRLQLFSDNSIPSGARASIYQYPFFGFLYSSLNNSYTFIGLFTAGPDKGDKKTFKFDETETYPSLMSLEGPNHAPLATRFLTPWLSDNSNVSYDSVKEKIRFSGEEGWDVAVAGDLGTDDADDNTAILAMATSEWKPAYNFVFYCSPFIIPLSSTNYNSISALNAAIETFRGGTSTITINGTQRTIKNELTQIYDSSYNLYGYVGGAYVDLGYNLLTDAPYTVTSGNTAAQIIAARGAYFASHIGDFFDKNWAVYHWCFCTRYALTDNFAKNTYPVKYKTLANGGRWAWREDDMDTLFKTDNNGNQTKGYSVEHGDLVDGVEIFQGGDGAFWVLVREFLQTDISNMMNSMTTQFHNMAVTLGIQGNYVWEDEFNVVDYYFWAQSSQYFGINGYNFDRDFKYIEPWYLNAGSTYNGVKPLTQALGDQYQCEREWVTKRLAYIYSKYRLAGMSGATEGFGNAAFTLSQSYTFTITPAIDYYPVCSLGDTNYPTTGEKIEAGDSVTVTIPSSGSTNNYFHGMNYLANIGDLSDMTLTTRGGSSSTAIPFDISSDRLQELVVGKASGTVPFNATSLSLTNCYSLTTLDARNASSLSTGLSLKTCPRLKNVYLSGTSLPDVSIAKGARIETLTLPATLQSLYLNNAPLLSTLTLDSWSGIRSVYMSNLQHLDQTGKFFEFIESVLYNKTQASPIVTDAYYISWYDLLTENMTPEQFIAFGNFAQFVVDNPNDFGWVEYNNAGDTYNNRTGNIVLSGHIDKGYVNYRDVFSDVTYETAYIKFKDPVMHKICLDRYQSGSTQLIYSLSNGDDISDADAGEAGLASNIIYSRYDVYDDNDDWVKTYLLEDLLHNSVKNLTSFAHLYGSQYSTEGTSFDELQYFDSLTSFGGTSSAGGAFRGWTKLKSVKLPPKVKSYAYSFYQCPSLEEIELPDAVTSLGQSAFGECTSLHTVKIGSGLTSIGMYAFSSDSALVNIHIKSIAQWIHISVSAIHHPFSHQTNTLPRHLFLNGVELTNVVIPEGTTGGIAPSSFRYCKNITSISIPEGITTIGDYAFADNGITSLTLPDTLTTFGSYAVSNSTNFALLNMGRGTVSFSANAIGNMATSIVVNYPDVESVFNKIMGSNSCPAIRASEVTINNELATSIVVPNSVTSIRTYSCHYFRDLTTITFHNNITSIGANAFSYTNLTSAIVPNSVTTIGNAAFSRISTISTLTIGSGVTSIGEHLVSYRGGALTVYILPTTPPPLGTNAFWNSTSNLKIYVPSASLDTYKGATNWATWKDYMYGATVNNDGEFIVNGVVVAHY